MPEGAPQDPSSRRAIRMPEPVEAENCRPARAAVKIARPAAFLRTEGGILRRARERVGVWDWAPSSASC